MILKLRSSTPESRDIFSVITERNGREFVVGAVVLAGGIFPPVWQWTIQMLSQPILPEPTSGTTQTRAGAMAAFRARWDELLPLITEADWQRKWDDQEAVRAREEAWHARNPHFPKR